jgi:hypothetical protein
MQDISVSDCSRHLRLRLSPVYATLGLKGGDFSRSHEVEIDPQCGCAINTAGNAKGGVGGMTHCIYRSFCNFFVQHMTDSNFFSNLVFCSLMNTQQLYIQFITPPDFS